VFVVQAKLPHKKMLIFTGILIGAVLLQMVGNTAHVLQIVGWLPIHPIARLTSALPYWTGMWFGLYGTWEGIVFQFAAAAFTIGSYFLAEHGQKRTLAATAGRQAASQPQ
jgi:high-affinity iron transporter